MTSGGLIECFMPWHDGGLKKVPADWMVHDSGCKDSPFCNAHVVEMLIQIALGEQKEFEGLEPIHHAENYPTETCPDCGKIVMIVLDPLQDNLEAELAAKMSAHYEKEHASW